MLVIDVKEDLLELNNLKRIRYRLAGNSTLAKVFLNTQLCLLIGYGVTEIAFAKVESLATRYL